MFRKKAESSCNCTPAYKDNLKKLLSLVYVSVKAVNLLHGHVMLQITITSLLAYSLLYFKSMILSKACNLSIVEIPREIPSKIIEIIHFKHYPRITCL